MLYIRFPKQLEKEERLMQIMLKDPVCWEARHVRYTEDMNKMMYVD